MTMRLSRGDDSRTAGAPADSFPGYEDAVRERYDILIAAGEVPELAMTKARADVDAMMAHQADWLKSRADYSTLAGEHRRNERAAAQGVNPDDLPADEFGNVSSRTVRDANLPIDEQEARLRGYQGRVDAVTKALREGRFHGTEESELRYDQEQGFGTSLSETGKSDLDYYRQQQQHQGSIRTGRGEVIPMGPEPTPENIKSMREFDEAVNRNPGSEFQAQYDPASYEEYREGVREGYRADARADEFTFGTGPDRNVAPHQLHNRQARAAAEERVNNSDYQQRRRQERLAARAGLSPDAAAMQINTANEARNAGMSPDDRFEESLRVRGNLGRQADRQDRRDLVAQRGELRGAGLSPAVGDFRNRTDDLIDRLGQSGNNNWQQAALLGNAVAGTEIANPSPLGVEAVGQANAVRFMQNRAFNPDGQPDPTAATVAAGLEAELPVEERADLERDRSGGVLRGVSGAGRAMLGELANRFTQRPRTPPDRVREMIDAAVAQGIPEQDALAYAREKGFVAPSAPPAVAPPPAPGAPAPAPPGKPFSAPGARGGRRR